MELPAEIAEITEIDTTPVIHMRKGIRRYTVCNQDGVKSEFKTSNWCKVTCPDCSAKIENDRYRRQPFGMSMADILERGEKELR